MLFGDGDSFVGEELADNKTIIRGEDKRVSENFLEISQTSRVCFAHILARK